MKKTILFLGMTFLACMAGVQQVSAAPKAKHVVLIGLDGWGSYSFEKANIPNIKALKENGSFTLAKRSVLPSSSAVNWASMFMGAGPELHGYTEWGSKTPELPSRELNRNGIFPTIYQLLRDANPKAEIGCLYEWDGIKYLVDTLSVNHFSQHPYNGKGQASLTEASVDYIKAKRPTLVGIFYDNPDHVGHKVGHDTPEYYQMLTTLDGYVGRIVQAVKDAGMLKETIFIVTADHGGINKGHGGKTMREMETPFIVSGKNVRKGFALDRSMMQFDVASTMAYLFDLKQPQVWIGRPMKEMFK